MPDIKVMSFSYLKGEPEGWTVFDARKIPNTYFSNTVSGLDMMVQDEIMSKAAALSLVQDILKATDDESVTNVAIGCTWGRHRSVAVAEEVGFALGVNPQHRDLHVTGSVVANHVDPPPVVVPVDFKDVESKVVSIFTLDQRQVKPSK